MLWAFLCRGPLCKRPRFRPTAGEDPGSVNNHLRAGWQLLPRVEPAMTAPLAGTPLVSLGETLRPPEEPAKLCLVS